MVDQNRTQWSWTHGGWLTWTDNEGHVSWSFMVYELILCNMILFHDFKPSDPRQCPCCSLFLASGWRTDRLGAKRVQPSRCALVWWIWWGIIRPWHWHPAMCVFLLVRIRSDMVWNQRIRDAPKHSVSWFIHPQISKFQIDVSETHKSQEGTISGIAIWHNIPWYCRILPRCNGSAATPSWNLAATSHFPYFLHH